MVGFAILLISFPAEMTAWPAVASLSGYHLGIIDSFNIIFFEQLPKHLVMDTISSATPLDSMKTQLGQFITVHEIKTHPLFGDFGAKGWEWVGNTLFLSGCWLIYKKIISWHIPFAVLFSLFITAGFFFLFDADTHPSPLFHIFSGATILGAFFIATDFVTSPLSNKGKLIYGAGIGILIYIIRTWGGYPDGVAFAVLFMNMLVPLIDYYIKPRTFGHKS
jgi:electron transport complex protein RnfD